jgi:hypothetical protein
MKNACIFVDLAEEILAVNELEWSSPQCGKRETQAAKLSVSHFGDCANHISIVKAVCIGETLPNSATSAWAGLDELHFRKIQHLAVVQIDGELKGEEIAQRWIRTKYLECLPQ